MATREAVSSRDRAPGVGSLWSHGDFMWLWAGQSVSLVGSNISYLALPLTALLVLHATPFQLGLITMLGGLPYLLVSLPAGLVVDRSRKRVVLILCDVGRAAILASVPVAVMLHRATLGQMYVVAAATGTLSVFFDAAYMSYPAVLLDRDRLVEANAKVGTSVSFAQTAGPMVGGWLVELLGAARAVAADAISFAVSAATLLAIRHREARPQRQERTATQFWKELREGLGLVAADPMQRALTISNSINNFSMVGATTIWLYYVVRHLHWTSGSIGLVLGLSAIGGIVGSLLVRPLVGRFGVIRVMLVTQLFYGPGEMVVFAVRPGLTGQIVVAIGFFALMFASAIYIASQLSFRQLTCPTGLLGRMNASVRWLQWGLRPLAGVLAGTLAAQTGVRTALFAFTLGLFVGPLFLWLSPIRSARNSTLRRVGKPTETHDAPA
jgi:MFS family permease